MSLFVLADLHLSSNGEKSMDVFGPRWANYMEKIKKNWSAVIKPTDTVILPGDISWGLRPEDALEDFRFLDALPGQKLIGKGNHDYWWTTATKFRAFTEKHGLSTLEMLYNNAYLREGHILCGTRGWFMEENIPTALEEVDYAKIVNRECIRLKLSLEEGRRLQENGGSELPMLVFLHFPPVWNSFLCREILDLLHEYGIKTCYFGHIHGAYKIPGVFEFEGIDFVLTSADYLNFAPKPIFIQ